ncbi:MAG: FAD-dependent oxidoreductase [Planctomycetes bacterium]|nr:FAD-dependent oxidoreductase [Planctomycetota bacterium]
MKIAVVGTGVSGLVAAHRLHPEHDLTVFEADDRIGGHVNTLDLRTGGRSHAVDTGFIVFNERTYPGFCALLDELGVASRPSTMSFSVRDERTGLEYNGHSLDTLFAQRRNLLRPTFLRMIADILRFNRQARELLEGEDDGLTLGEYLDRGRWSRAFLEQYILPMGAAIWSSGTVGMRAFPARAFVRFFENHGMLSVDERPQWRVVEGGSRSYVEALVRPFRERIRSSSPVDAVRRLADGVEVTVRGDAPERFDAVVIAVHSDQALAMLADPSASERAVLGAIGYQRNEAVVHTDERMLPRARKAWAAWNYHVTSRDDERVAVTYDMNALQGLDAEVRFLVTLNHVEDIDPTRVLRRITYHHPVFTPAALAAQRRHAEISGVRRTFYCGAYWGYGFHEDGHRSAVTALAQLERLARGADAVRRDDALAVH